MGNKMRDIFLFFCLGIGALACLGLGLATIALRLLLSYGPSVVAVGLFIYLVQDVVRWVWKRNHATPLPTAKHRAPKRAKA